MARYNFGAPTPNPFRGSAGRFNFNPAAFAQPEPEEDEYTNIINRYRSVLNQEQPALQKFRDFSRQVPRGEDYQPGFMGKLAAALSGFGVGLSNPQAGYQIAREQIESPYRRALEDFDINRGLLGEEAQFEREDRSNQLKGLDYELEAYGKRLENLRENQRLQGQLGRWGSQNLVDVSTITDRDRNYGLKVNDQAFDQTMKMEDLGLRNRDTRSRERGVNIDAFNANTRQNELGLKRDIFGHDQMMDVENLGLNARRTREYESRDSGRGQTFVSPEAQAKAEMMALDSIYTEFPQYRKFIDRANPGFPTINKNMNQRNMSEINPETGKSLYREFIAELQGRKRSVLDMQRGSGGGSRYDFNFEDEQ